MYTRQGLRAIASRYVSNECDPFVFLGIGEGDKGLSDQDTILEKEIRGDGMQRVQAEIGEDVDGHITLSAKFVCMRPAVIREIAVFNALNGGVMLKRQLIGPYTVALGTEYTARFILNDPENE
ncbi:MAG: hypothetical protein WC477_07775 [Patescibacteria group bacterium]